MPTTLYNGSLAYPYLKITADVVSGVKPLAVAFTITNGGSTASNAQQISQILFRFGDGQETTASTVTHTYHASGKYTLYCKVVYTDGAWTDISLPNAITVYEYAIASGGIDGTLLETSYCYGDSVATGIGFSKNTGTAFPVVESGVGALTVYDNLNVPHLWYFDSQDGLPYDMTTREGSVESGLIKCNRDKTPVGGDVSGGGGTNIVPLVKFPVDSGTSDARGRPLPFTHINLESMMHSIVIKPDTQATRGTTNHGIVHDSNGFINGTVIDVSQFTDGEQITAQVQALDITPPKWEILLERRKTGHEHELQVSVDHGEIQICNRVSYYLARDIPENPDSRKQSEAKWQLYMNQNLQMWITRGAALLLDRIANKAISGTVSAITGPDGKTNSAMSVSGSPIGFTNPGGAGAYMTAWYKSGSEIHANGSAVAFTQIGSTTSGGWVFGYSLATIAASLQFMPGGSFFDVRIYSVVGSNDADTREYAYNDIVNNAGKNVLPLW